jgi:hypothetical protein
MKNLTEREAHLLMLAFSALKGSTIYEDERIEAQALRDKITARFAAANPDREMLRGIWSSLWTYDDYSEVCFPIDVRNELGEYLVSVGAITAQSYEPLDPEGNEK